MPATAVRAKQRQADQPAVFKDPGAVVGAYMKGVLDGTIPAAKYVMRAVVRQVHDLEHGAERGLSFDEDAAARAVRFFSFLRHWKGEWGPKNGQPGQVFEPRPWQAFLTWCLFGWKRADGTRRFRSAYVSIPRKNGKTSWLAGVGLYLMMADGEPGAEVYSFATKRDQARIVIADAAAYVRASPSLSTRLRVSGGQYVNNISFAAAASKWEPTAADSKKQDGYNVHAGLGDELHEHPSSGMWDVMETGTGARRQPLMIGITTAGSDRDSFCGQLDDYTCKLLDDFDKPEGIRNDAFFGFVSGADKEDDWADPQVWEKANPNYGVSVKPDDLADKCAKAKSMPSARNTFLRKHLNVWTESEEAWIPVEAWDACRDDDFDWAEGLRGRECIGGMDLASKLDLTALVLVFGPGGDDPKYRVKAFFWIPADTAAERERADRIPYRQWIEEELIEATPGNVTDYDYVEKRAVEIAGQYSLREIAFDPWNATQTALHLKDDHGIPMVEFRQGMVSMNEPSKEFERLVASGDIAHDGNPVLRWMMGNAVVKRDESGNIRPVKPEQKRKRVDGVICVVMGIGRWVTQPEAAEFDVRIV